MADTSISGIAKVVLQARADFKAANPDKAREGVDFSASFMNMMNQNNFQSGVSRDSHASVDSLAAAAGSRAETPVYDSYTAKQGNVSVREEITSEKLQTEGADELNDFAKDVYEALEEEYHVSKEEIDAVLMSLGLSVADLMNPQNLVAFVTELTGEDVVMLFLSESFQNVMQEISVLTEELAANLGLTKEQLMALVEEMNQNVPDLDVSEDQDIEIAEPIQTGEEKKSQTIAALTGNGKEAISVEEASEGIESSQEAKEEQPGQMTVTQAEGEDAEESSQNGKESNFFEHGKDTKTEHDVSNAHMIGGLDNMVEEFILPEDAAVPAYTSQVNVADIIEQIASHVKVSISAEVTSLEMQLNPESLGKIYLNITEKEGVIRAQIAAQNEAVKEALETQMVELRQSLNQQGIRVDAIEVTVATHEFEQNLEGQAKQEEQMQQQMNEEQKKTRRNLNLNELDSLVGLMSEEEELVAKMMRDNGNQVDLTA